MGKKNGYLIIVMLLFPFGLIAQEHMNYKDIDSLTYRYYNLGEWEKLTRLGDSAINEKIDFKYLRLRMGFAFFSRGKYYDAKYQFEKALQFDSYDSFGLEYLYYCYLNLGKEEYSGSVARKLNIGLKKTFSIHPFKPIESIDLEYNFKYSGAQSRSNPMYYRAGINTQIGFGLNLYQSFSGYNQSFLLQYMGSQEQINYNQPEYYARLDWTLSKHLLFKVAYHYINSNTNTTVTNGNLFLFAISPELNRFTISPSFSALYLQQQSIYQGNLQFGYVFPGRLNFYLNGTLSREFKLSDSPYIYTQKAGMKISRTIWIEANSTFGEQADYNDYDGLYVYNSLDPITSRSGGTLFFYPGKRISFWMNFSLERKAYYENTNIHYNQFSYLGGLRWKI